MVCKTAVSQESVSVLMQLVDENQFPIDLGNGPVTTVTDGTGHFLFDGIPEGRYRVRVAPSNFQSGGVLEFFRSSTGVEADINTDGDLSDNGIDNAARDIEGVVSAVVELERNLEPTGEVDLGVLGSGSALNENSNLTVDFGLINERAPILALGNRVWLDQSSDLNTNNGTQEAGEPGIEGVLLELLGPLGQVLTQTSTDSSGFYLFEGLIPGIYSVRVAASNFESGAVLEFFGQLDTHRDRSRQRHGHQRQRSARARSCSGRCDQRPGEPGAVCRTVAGRRSLRTNER